MQHPRQRHQPHWWSLFLLVLLCTILVQSLDATPGLIVDPVLYKSSEAHFSKESTSVEKTVTGLGVPGKNGFTRDRLSESVLDLELDNSDQRITLPSNRKDFAEDEDVDILDDSTSSLDRQRSSLSSVPPSSSFPSLQRRDSEIDRALNGTSIKTPQIFLWRPEVTAATTLCNSGTPDVQGPGWHGSISSNSPGAYPPQTRSCTWTMLAFTNSTFGVDANGKSTTPFIIRLTFWGPMQLVCG